MEKRQRRKLAVILHADVVGSTILVQRDETLAHDRMQDSFRRFSETIRAYGGSTHELRGDALVAEFDRASDAVCAALAFQVDNTQFNDGLDGDVRPELRVGISMGEMVIADRTVTGPGVVLAQRLEQMAEPSGVIVQGAAHETIPRRLPFEYQFLGEREVKGFEEPVRAYAVSLTPGEIIPPPEGRTAPKGKWLAVAVLGLVLAAAGGLAWFQPWVVREEPASVERMAHPLPDKPSIAVLPFANMSGGSDQEYFSDGLTENLITTLSQLPDVFVIARNSSFSYKGNPVKVQQVAEELGVRYVVEGSFQRAGDHIRVHAQFIDALTGIQLWAERYDRPWSDVFLLQDDLTRNIVSSLALELSDEQRIQLSRHYTKDPEAYDHFLRGQAAFYGYSAENNARAREMYRRAIDRDPDFARAVAALALSYAYDFRFGWNNANQASLKRARELSRKALTMDDTLPQIHLVASAVHQFAKEHRETIEAGHRAIALDPNYADAYVSVAFSQTYMGNAFEAIESMQKAIRLNPNTPSIYYVALGRALFFAGRLEEAKLRLERAVEMNPTFLIAHVMLAAVWSQIGDQDEAEWKAEEVLTLDPDFSVETWLANEPLVDLTYADTLRKALLGAGLPDRPVSAAPDKPSIAVLPFLNMSGDKEQEYFSDGISEDLITDLSKISALTVIARTSSFVYKGQNPDVREVGKDLGVSYVLEGSVRKAGNQIRINAQLVDATSGSHLWAERYDGSYDDVFALQDKVTAKIVTTLAVKLTSGEQDLIGRKQTHNTQAYDAFLKGWEQYQLQRPESFARSIDHFEQAIELDPSYSRAYAALSATYWQIWKRYWHREFSMESPHDPRFKAEEYLLEAKRQPTSLALQVSTAMLSQQGYYDEALAESERAITLDPNDADGYVAYAGALNLAGRHSEALEFVEQAIRLNPSFPSSYLYELGLSQFSMDRFEDAAASLDKATALNSDDRWSLRLLLATDGHLGRTTDAENILNLAQSNWGGLDPLSIRSVLFWYPFKEAQDRERLADGLRKAGVPE